MRKLVADGGEVSVKHGFEAADFRGLNTAFHAVPVAHLHAEKDEVRPCAPEHDPDDDQCRGLPFEDRDDRPDEPQDEEDEAVGPTIDVVVQFDAILVLGEGQSSCFDALEA